MLRFKQFSGSGDELERDINAWLEQFEPDVTHLVQTRSDDRTVVISFLFEESFRGQELRLSAEAADDVPPAIPPGAMPGERIEVQS